MRKAIVVMFVLAAVVAAFASAVYAASTPLINCEAFPFYNSDGSECVTVVVTNTSTDPNSRISVTCLFQSGQQSSLTLGPNQSTQFQTRILMIEAHEIGAPNGEVSWVSAVG